MVGWHVGLKLKADQNARIWSVENDPIECLIVNFDRPSQMAKSDLPVYAPRISHPSINFLVLWE
jgi:hypothetical protein